MMGESESRQLSLSIVIPVYAGESYLRRIVESLDRLHEGLDSRDIPIRLHEAIFVLDEPIDDSRQILEEMDRKYPWVRLVELSRNFGQHCATVAGILHSSGDWVATMDEDLQHPPSSLPFVIASGAREHADVIYVTSLKGKHKSLYRNAASRSVKRLVGWLSGTRHVAKFSSFRVLRGQIARAAASVCGNETYFDMTLGWFTERVADVPLDLVDPRGSGGQKSGYGFFSLLRHAKRMLFSADIRFFRLATLVSAASFLFALIMLAWVFVSYFLSPE